MSRRVVATIMVASLLSFLPCAEAVAQSPDSAVAKPVVDKHRKAVSAPKSASDGAAAISAPASAESGVDARPGRHFAQIVQAPKATSSDPASAAPAATTVGSSAVSQAAPAAPAASAGAAASPAPGASGADASADSYPFTEDFGVLLLAIAVAVPATLLGWGWIKERKQTPRTPSRPAGVVWWGVALVLAVASVAYAYVRRETIGFWDGMVGAWLATLLGIVCGVPVALELERQRRRAEEAKKTDVAEKLRAQVLGMLREELERVVQQLKDRTDTPKGLPIEPLKTSTWDATRASGNLAAISEPELLQAFSEAYRWIGMIVTLEAQRIALMYGNDRLIGGDQYASVKLEALIRTFLQPATDWVNHALEFTANSTSTPAAPTPSLKP